MFLFIVKIYNIDFITAIYKTYPLYINYSKPAYNFNFL
jgi:hypothetical protein